MEKMTEEQMQELSRKNRQKWASRKARHVSVELRMKPAHKVNYIFDVMLAKEVWHTGDELPCGHHSLLEKNGKLYCPVCKTEYWTVPGFPAFQYSYHEQQFSTEYGVEEVWEAQMLCTEKPKVIQHPPEAHASMWPGLSGCHEDEDHVY